MSMVFDDQGDHSFQICSEVGCEQFASANYELCYKHCFSICASCIDSNVVTSQPSSDIPDGNLEQEKRSFVESYSDSNSSSYVNVESIVYSPKTRKKRIKRFLEKRSRRRWTKRVEYVVRKKFADSRARWKGRFVKNTDSY